MRAFVVVPGQPGSGRLAEVPEPVATSAQSLVEVLEVGVDGTDRELLSGQYGEAPTGEALLIQGHESLGRVLAAPAGTLEPGTLVVAIVRRPDPEPCTNCAAGEWDMCLNGRYTERGIKGAHGFLAERYVEYPAYLIAIPPGLEACGVLLEPLSVVEKALEQVRRIQTRLVWSPRRALVLGAGTIGTLATLLLRHEGLPTYLYSRGDGGHGRAVAEAAGAEFVSADDRALDATLTAELGPFDIVIEATGYSPLAYRALEVLGSNGVVCLTGITSGSRSLSIDADHVNQELVLENKLLFGSVNANRRHFEAGVRHMSELERTLPGLLSRIITRRVPLGEFSASVLERQEDLKVVVTVPVDGSRQ